MRLLMKELLNSIRSRLGTLHSTQHKLGIKEYDNYAYAIWIYVVLRYTTHENLKRTPSIIEQNLHRLSWVDTHNLHIISTKSEGSVETPQDIVEEYNGCSVPQYTRYPCMSFSRVGVSRVRNNQIKSLSPLFCGIKRKFINFHFPKYYIFHVRESHVPICTWLPHCWRRS